MWPDQEKWRKERTRETPGLRKTLRWAWEGTRPWNGGDVVTRGENPWPGKQDDPGPELQRSRLRVGSLPHLVSPGPSLTTSPLLPQGSQLCWSLARGLLWSPHFSQPKFASLVGTSTWPPFLSSHPPSLGHVHQDPELDSPVSWENSPSLPFLHHSTMPP